MCSHSDGKLKNFAAYTSCNINCLHHIIMQYDLLTSLFLQFLLFFVSSVFSELLKTWRCTHIHLNYDDIFSTFCSPLFTLHSASSTKSIARHCSRPARSLLVQDVALKKYGPIAQSTISPLRPVFLRSYLRLFPRRRHCCWRDDDLKDCAGFKGLMLPQRFSSSMRSSY